MQTGSATSSDRAILVHKRQKGNPMLRFIKNVPIRYTEDILSDFVLGSGAAALYLSLRYHLLNPGCITITCMDAMYVLAVAFVPLAQAF